MLTGFHPEPPKDAWALAEIGGIMELQADRRQHGKPWISAMPTNTYGPGINSRHRARSASGIGLANL